MYFLLIKLFLCTETQFKYKEKLNKKQQADTLTHSKGNENPKNERLGRVSQAPNNSLLSQNEEQELSELMTLVKNKSCQLRREIALADWDLSKLKVSLANESVKNLIQFKKKSNNFLKETEEIIKNIDINKSDKQNLLIKLRQRNTDLDYYINNLNQLSFDVSRLNDKYSSEQETLE